MRFVSEMILLLVFVYICHYRQCDAGTDARFPEVFKFNIDEVDYENGLEFEIEALNMSGSGKAKHIGVGVIRLDAAVPKFDLPCTAVVELIHYGKKELKKGQISLKAILMTSNVVRNRPAVLKLSNMIAKDLVDTGTMVDGQDPCLQLRLNDEVFTTER